MRKWLSTESIAEYLDCSISQVKKYIKNGDFEKGIHYFKPKGEKSKLFFDMYKIDEWVKNDNLSEEQQAIHSILRRVTS